jgi:hypothetical protein
VKFFVAADCHPHLVESFSACPAKRLALQAADMEELSAASRHRSNRIIQILSAINCRFLVPNSR